MTIAFRTSKNQDSTRSVHEGIHQVLGIQLSAADNGDQVLNLAQFILQILVTILQPENVRVFTKEELDNLIKKEADVLKHLEEKRTLEIMVAKYEQDRQQEPEVRRGHTTDRRIKEISQ